MKKNAATILLICAVTLGLALTGCGSAGSPDSFTAANQSQSKSIVYGVASLGTTTSGYVSAMDSSVPAQQKTAAISSNGSYTVDVSGFMPPYILKAEPTDNTGNIRMYSVSMTGGRTNINPISDIAVAAAANGTNPDDLFMRPDREMYRRTADNFESVIDSLRTVLAPLFALYQSSGRDPVTDDEGSEDDNSGLRAMFRDVRIVVTSGTVIVTNRQTGGVIFSGSLNNIASGTFYPENMPAGPGGTNTCAYTYSDWGTCQPDWTMTRTMLTSSPSGCTGTPVLTQSCTYMPSTSDCTSFTYSAWGTCTNGTQTRTVATSTPAGCTGGIPALSQSCTSASTLTLAQVTTSCTQCHGLTVNGVMLATGGYTVSGRTASAWVTAITGMGAVLAPGTTLQDYGNFLAGLSSTPSACSSFTYSGWGTCTNGTQTRTVATSSPAGCTGGTPALSQSCTSATACSSFTYSAWGTCQSDSTQTRTVATSSPTGCTGGTPVVSQSCTYVPPVNACTSFTYSAWGTCTNGTQTRTVATSSPASCTGGTPALSQSCTSASTLTLAQVTTSCTRCHGLTVNTTVLKSGGYSVSGRSASAWVSAITGMGATLAPGTTLQDYGNFLTALP